MLDLDPGVHLDEIEVTRVVDQELHGAGRLVVHGAGHGEGGPLEAGAGLGLEQGCGRLLEQLLVAALHRAVALPEQETRAVPVAEHLDLDVARVGHEFLAVELRRAERRAGLRLTGLERAGQPVGIADDPHAAAAPARRGLQDDRVADLVGHRARLVEILDGALATREDRRAGLLGGQPGLRLVPHEADGAGGRPDEGEPARLADVGEGRVLGEEAVAGMDGLAVGDFGGRDDPGDVEVALPCLRRPDADRLVREAGGKRLGVRRGVGDHGANAELPARPHDAEGDLPAVGDQDLLEHLCERGRPHWVTVGARLGGFGASAPPARPPSR